MGTQERRKREKENLRQEILDAARRLFIKNGFENVSMRQVAEKIEYSPTTIYLYFEDKSALFRSICEETFGKLERELEAIRKADQDPARCLRKGAEAYIRFGLHYPHHYQLVFMTPYPHKKDEKCQVKATAGDKAFGYLVEVISRGIEQGEFRAADPMVLAQTAWATMHGLTALLITKGDFLGSKEFPWLDRDVLIASTVELLLRGVSA